MSVSELNMPAALDGSSKEGRARQLGEWLAALTVLLAVLGMSFSSPPLVGPDEGVHQATASYLTVHVMPPVSDADDYIAGILKFGACMAFDSSKDASCMPGREDVGAAKARVVNYPPLYYWVVGLGQKAAPGADTWMDVGGRVASTLLNLAGLGLLVALARRRFKHWGSSLLAIATPMVVFLWAVVNPNGWEITSGLLFAFLFATAWWHSEAEPAGKRWWLVLAAVGASAIVFALARPAALLWLALLVLAIMLMGKSPLSRSRQLSVLGMAGLGILSGVLWQVTHPSQSPINNPDRVADPTVGDRLHWLNQIDEVLPDRLRQMTGVIGNLDTPVPQWMVLLLIVGWAAVIGFLYARTRIPTLALVVGFLGVVLVPSMLETVQWNDWPYWWQGRYTLPFVVPFLFVFLLRFGRYGARAVTLLSLVSAGVLTFMVWQNLMRYAFGVRDYIPLRWDTPAMTGLAYWGTLIVIALLVVVTVIRAWLFARHSESHAVSPG